MKYSEKLVATIKAFEGFVPVAKHEDIDRPGVITGGYGDTNVTLGQRFTEEEADKMLRARLDKLQLSVTNLLKDPNDITPSELDALMDFAYNCGVARLGQSDIIRDINSNNISSICAAFARYNKANGKVLPGLVRRRKMEVDWFTSGK